MSGAQRAAQRWLGVVTVLAVAGGCQTPQRQAREDAAQRWNLARARVKARLAADQFAGGNVSTAARELAEALRLDPSNPELIPLQARIWLAQGNTGAAAALLERTELAGSAQGEIDYLLGVVRQQQQRWDEALALFLKAAERDEHRVAYVVAAAQLLLQLGRPHEALGMLMEKMARQGWTSAYQTAIAECHEQLGEWSAAASAWQHVAAAEGADPGARERLAVALFRARRYIEAAPVLAGLVEAHAAEVPAWLRLMLAECYLAEGRCAAAREQVQAVLQRAPRDVAGLRLLARILGAGADYEAALRVAARAVELDPAGVPTLELAAALAWRAGDLGLATARAARLCQLDPGNAAGQSILRQAQASAALQPAD